MLCKEKKNHRSRYSQDRRERTEDVERADDNKEQEDRIVVEDGEGGGLVVGHFVLLPEDPGKRGMFCSDERTQSHCTDK